jgi:hypothetical protein
MTALRQREHTNWWSPDLRAVLMRTPYLRAAASKPETAVPRMRTRAYLIRPVARQRCRIVR